MSSNEVRVKVIESKIKKGVTTNIISMTKDFTKFNNIIGLPKHPQTFKEQNLTKIQMKVFDAVMKPKRQNKLHLNKARQNGWTELILRGLAFNMFDKYAGGKIVIMAGTREKTTKDIFTRFKALFKHIPEYVMEDGPLYLKLYNGAAAYGFPANPEAVTGWTKIKAFFLDESTKWNLIDDYPVVNSVMPIVRTNKADLFMISTPKGPRGFFYDFDIAENDFHKFVIDIWEGGKELYSRD